MKHAFAIVSLGLGLSSCAAEPVTQAAAPFDCGGPGALAACLQPNRDPEWYVGQAQRYFDTLDADAPVDSYPDYADQVARWEWEPWLKLTGWGRTNMIAGTIIVTRFATPSTVPVRDCRFFGAQPFARCRVEIRYQGGPCPIFEEFTFNESGQVTFIEAWTDLPGWHPAPDPLADPWAEGPDVRRMATKIPGLGTSNGAIDLDGPAMRAAEATDPDVADFARRARDFWTWWADELSQESGLSEADVYGYGCGWDRTESTAAAGP